MIPTIALVGRPNVGKSTLFNRLTRSRQALVADLPGLTRDRHYGLGRIGPRPLLAVDTGGLAPGVRGGLYPQMARQAWQAIDEADAVLFLVDGREGVTPDDREIAGALRKRARRVWLVVNKAEGSAPEAAAAPFYELGLGDPLPISAAHGDGVHELIDLVLAHIPLLESSPSQPVSRGPRIAVVGRPNVGKSSLVNAILGEERMIASDQPGTTRDSIHIEFERSGRPYTLIDTAGLRRRGKVDDVAEKFSVIKTMQAIEEANVAILVLDASQEIAEQDAHIASFILEAGRALVVALNKWDGLDPARREQAKREFRRKLGFLDFARVHYVSALSGMGLDALLRSVDAAYAAAMIKLPTPRLTRALIQATTRQPPPRAGFSRPKLRYAHQGGSNPPVIVIHGSQLDQLPESYRRYLARCFVETFGLQGTPVRLQLRVTENPYAHRR